MQAWWKRAIAGLSAAALLAFGGPCAAAWAGTPDRPDVYVDGQLLHFDTQPIIYQDRTLVPMRMIFESLGAEVSWEARTSTAIAVKDGVTLRLPIDSKTATKNDQTLPLDVPAQLVHNRTMVPVRFIAEAFGNKVTWDERGRVVIEGGDQAPAVRVIGADYYGLKEGQTTQVQELLRTQNIVAQVEKEAGLSFQMPVWIYLTNSDAGYKQAIATYGDPSDADGVDNVSEGVTYGNTVILPLHRNSEKASDLPMTVAHELLHVLLNQNGGFDLPSWVHEGLAWQAGLDAAYAGQAPLLRRMQDAMMRDYVLDIVKNGKYQPLIDDHDATIQALSASYNVELQDYLAYRYLIEQQGQAKFSAYLDAFALGDSAAFQHSFGLTPAAFETQFKHYLDQEAAKTSRGVAITFQVPASLPDNGILSITTQGTGEQRERDVMLGPGRYTVYVYKDGRIEGIETVPGEYIAQRDAQAAFLTLRMKTAQKFNGLDTRDGGFVLYDSFGEYMLSSVWTDDLQGQDHYSEASKLFGVEILDIQTIR